MSETELLRQQIIGFLHGRAGYSLVSLLSAAGATAEECKAIKIEMKSHLSSNDHDEINLYARAEGKEK